MYKLLLLLLIAASQVQGQDIGKIIDSAIRHSKEYHIKTAKERKLDSLRDWANNASDYIATSPKWFTLSQFKYTRLFIGGSTGKKIASTGDTKDTLFVYGSIDSVLLALVKTYGIKHIVREEQPSIEIQTLRLLNDSLTRRLKEQIEYRVYTSEIIKCISTRNKMGDIRVYFKDQWGGRIAFLRYEKRYKKEQ